MSCLWVFIIYLPVRSESHWKRIIEQSRTAARGLLSMRPRLTQDISPRAVLVVRALHKNYVGVLYDDLYLQLLTNVLVMWDF